MARTVVDLDALIEVRDGLEDSGLADHPDVARAITLTRLAIDQFFNRTWGAFNPRTGRAIETPSQEAAEALVESLDEPWVLAAHAPETGWVVV